MLLSLLLAAGPMVKAVVAVDAPVVALAHVRVIDGTGAPPREDQTLVMSGGKLVAGPPPAGAKVLDLRGRTVIPGLVGMHEHLFWAPKELRGPTMFREMFFVPQPYSFPRLYLAAGVTTARTAGTVSPDTDLAVKQQIESGEAPGPRLDVTGPYLEGPAPFFVQMPPNRDEAQVRQLVAFWAARGATSFKAYMGISRAMLKAAIDEAHARGLKVAGHLCAVTFHEAAELGIDSLEHGIFVDTDFSTEKKPDVCAFDTMKEIAKLDVNGPKAQELIAMLVKHHVAIDSTLAVFAASLGEPLDMKWLSLAIPDAIKSVEAAHRKNDIVAAAVPKEIAFEHAFMKAGGLLIAGADPTGDGSVLAGQGDQRGLELLVEGGFTPLEAIRVATRNGAEYLGRLNEIGTLEPGKRADVVVLNGDPTKDIHDIEKVELVFKDGVGYDPQKLIESTRGSVGLR